MINAACLRTEMMVSALVSADRQTSLVIITSRIAMVINTSETPALWKERGKPACFSVPKTLETRNFRSQKTGATTNGLLFLRGTTTGV